MYQQPPGQPQQPPYGQPQWGQPSQPPNTYYPPQQPPQYQSGVYPFTEPRQMQVMPASPPQYRPMPPMQPSRKKKSKIGLILAIIGGILLLSCIGMSVLVTGATHATPAMYSSNSTSSNSKITSNQSQGKWTTTQSFTGNGIKKTAIFHIGDNWKIVWSCNPASFYGGQYNLVVTVTNSDNTPVDVAVNTICKAGNTADSTQEHQGGDVYLDINSEGAWKIQIQELK